MATKTFTRTWHGHNNAVYTCMVCGKRTRETGLGEAALDLCAYCYEEAGIENELADGHITKDEFDAKIAALRKEYKRK